MTDLEREALEYLISKEFMRRAGLEVGPNGSILSSNDKDNFLPVATLDAVKKALQYL
ncbi:gamma-mobile-trio protein GmtX [Pseudoalteromonas sp. 2CM28B]|nr:gamma-mobile-trio protein GmtX [Pseudoalteromonas sp. 2CM28B]